MLSDEGLLRGGWRPWAATEGRLRLAIIPATADAQDEAR